MKFDESKHPRDGDGKFKDKNSLTNKQRFEKDQAERERLARKYDSDGTREHRQNTPYEDIIVANGAKVPKGALTKDEWAQYYRKLGEVKAGGYVDKTASGDYVFTIGNKVIFSTADYERPKCLEVWKYPTEDSALYALDEITVRRKLWH